MLPNRKRAIAVLAAICVMTLAVAPQTVAAQGTQTGQIPGIQVALTSVARTPTGPVLVKWTYQNTGAQPQTIAEAGCYLEANGKKYPASVSSVGKGGVVVAAHATVAAWAVVAGTDASVTTVTVHINGAAPFKDIPVSSS